MAHAMNLNAYALPSGRPGVFARLRDAIANRLEYVRLHDELNAYSDRELADIGLSRDSVRLVAQEAVYGR